MRTVEGVLEEYRNRDFYGRLNLYLEHRDLRPQFMQIDSDMRAPGRARSSEQKASKILSAIDSIRYKIARSCSP
jgi:hypothetical protein